MCKIHWKLMIFDSLYRFPNISATKAWIFSVTFSKFVVVINSHKNFGKDLFTQARTQGVNARTCDEMCAGAFLTRARMCMHGSSPKFLWMFTTIKFKTLLDFKILVRKVLPFTTTASLTIFEIQNILMWLTPLGIHLSRRIRAKLSVFRCISISINANFADKQTNKRTDT